jgi:hypothetical protein
MASISTRRAMLKSVNFELLLETKKRSKQSEIRLISLIVDIFVETN